jgi:hypothetical protein
MSPHLASAVVVSALLIAAAPASADPSERPRVFVKHHSSFFAYAPSSRLVHLEEDLAGEVTPAELERIRRKVHRDGWPKAWREHASRKNILGRDYGGWDRLTLRLVGHFRDGLNDGAPLALVEVRLEENRETLERMKASSGFYVLFRKTAVTTEAPATAAPPAPEVKIYGAALPVGDRPFVKLKDPRGYYSSFHKGVRAGLELAMKKLVLPVEHAALIAHWRWSEQPKPYGRHSSRKDFEAQVAKMVVRQAGTLDHPMHAPKRMALLHVVASEQSHLPAKWRPSRDFYVLYDVNDVALRAERTVAEVRRALTAHARVATAPAASPSSDWTALPLPVETIFDKPKLESCDGWNGRVACAREQVRAAQSVQRFYTDWTAGPGGTTNTRPERTTSGVGVTLFDPTGSMREGCAHLSAPGFDAGKVCAKASVDPNLGSAVNLFFRVPPGGVWDVRATVNGRRQRIHIFIY